MVKTNFIRKKGNIRHTDIKPLSHHICSSPFDRIIQAPGWHVFFLYCCCTQMLFSKVRPRHVSVLSSMEVSDHYVHTTSDTI